jgi:hypothetical protein
MEINPKRAGRRLQVGRNGTTTVAGRIDEHRNHGRCGEQLTQQF